MCLLSVIDASSVLPLEGSTRWSSNFVTDRMGEIIPLNPWEMKKIKAKLKVKQTFRSQT